MAIRCSRNVLRGGISKFREAFGMARDTMKKMEGLIYDQGVEGAELPIWSKVGAVMFEATRKGKVWRSEMSAQLEKIASRMSSGEQENIMAYLFNPARAAELGYNITAGQKQSAQQLRKLMKKVLTDAGGLTNEQAELFLSRDLMKLRQVGGDVNRLGGTWNIYPESFQPFLKDIQRGELSAATNNAYGLTWELINMGNRHRFLRPAYNQAKAEVRSWDALRGKISGEDITFAKKIADDFLTQNMEMIPESTDVISAMIKNTVTRINKMLGRDVQITDDTINRWAMNMASWYGGLAMSARPALAVRNMTQVMLPATKVGYGRLGRALKDTYGSNRKEHIGRALKELGIPLEGENAVFLNEGKEGFLGSRFFRTIRDMQNKGLRPYRWADRVNNRATTFRMGELAIEDAAPKYLSGKMSWEEFLFETGLKGSPRVDQVKIKALLGGEQPNIAQAAREYGKVLVEDTQFIYDGVNSPLSFKGALGRLFGQFGVWPIGFTEFMYQNTMQRDSAWVRKFLGNYGIQKSALIGLGMATGVDTSSWNYANPLTFQGGPWFQAIRDTAVLGTSLNEFERRQARTTVSRMWGRMGTPFAGIMNPFGALTVDILQAQAAENPLNAALLGLGFNLRDVSPATSR